MKLKPVLVCYSKLPVSEGEMQRPGQNKRLGCPAAATNSKRNIKFEESFQPNTPNLDIYRKILREPVNQALQGRTLCLISYENSTPQDSLAYHVLTNIVKQHTASINWISVSKDQKPQSNQLPLRFSHPQTEEEISGLLTQVKQSSQSTLHSVIQISVENPCINLCQINLKDERWNPENFIASFKEISNNLNKARVKSHSRSSKSQSLLQNIILSSQQVILMVDNQHKKPRRRSPIGRNIQNYIQSLQIKNKKTQEPSKTLENSKPSIIKAKKQEPTKTKKKEPIKMSESLDRKTRLKTMVDVTQQKPEELVSRTEKSLPKEQEVRVLKTDWSNQDEQNLLSQSQLDASALQLQLCQSYLKNTLVFEQEDDFIVPCTFKSQFKWNRITQHFHEWDPQTQKALGYFTEAEQFLQQQMKEIQANLEQLHSETVSKEVETMKGQIELINSLQETRAACDPIDYADTIELAIDIKMEQLTKLKKQLTEFRERQKEYEGCNNKLTEAYRKSGKQATISRFLE